MDKTPVTGIVELLAKAVGDVDPTKVEFIYDGDADTLTVHLFGRGYAATSILITDVVMIRYDREGGRVVGVQIEHFLNHVAREHPELLNLLDVAELRDVSPMDIAQRRREIVSEHRSAVVSHILGDLRTLAAAAD
jgi:uncharacterized protein YuzE